MSSRTRTLMHTILLLTSTLLVAQPTTGSSAWSDDAMQAAAAHAWSKLDASLVAELHLQQDDALVPIIVMLEEKLDLERLEAEIVTARLARDARAARVIDALERIAGRSQPPLQAQLDHWAAAGRVEQVRPLWIINAFLLRARPETILELAARDDVGSVFLDGALETESLLDVSPAAASPGQAEPGLRAVGAPTLWGMGYTGADMIVMNIDSGVDGTHPSLSAHWLGNRPEIPAAEAWYDPVQGTCPTPCDYGSHGTATMGPLTAFDPATADTIGVAFGAEWIAGALVVSGSSTSHVLTAFQWALDPGGNPSARGPAHVINCSFQDGSVSLPAECGPNGTYWEVVDAFEAAGGAIVWAAGNLGPAPQSITLPKNRISTPVNMFTVGNVSAHQPTYPIHSSSSRGPSRCDSATPKPEVVAPGTSVRYPAAYGGYVTGTGTSLAAPHTAGVIALLMQAFPWATGTEIKFALLGTAIELGAPGDDNTYGNGFIDAGAAHALLSGAAAIREAEQSGGPGGVTLGRSVPNPFNPTTSIDYALDFAATVRLGIYAVRGRRVAMVVNGVRTPAGAHRATWDGTMADGRPAPSGLYLFRLEATADGPGGRSSVRLRKAILLQ